MIINLTQHAATAEQVAVGVVDLPAEQREALIDALTFESIPDAEEIRDRAHTLPSWPVLTASAETMGMTLSRLMP